MIKYLLKKERLSFTAHLKDMEEMQETLIALVRKHESEEQAMLINDMDLTGQEEADLIMPDEYSNNDVADVADVANIANV